MSNASRTRDEEAGDVAAVLVAAGAGTRLGDDLPKALVPLSGTPLVVRSTEMLAAAGIAHIVVVAPPDHRAAVTDALAHCTPSPTIVPGAASRAGSVRAGLAACPPAAHVIAVHDAARALCTAQLVRRTLAALVDPWVGVAPGVPVVDTLKLVDTNADHRVMRTVSRESLWAVQTPQVFRRRVLEQAHARLDDASAGGPTDDLTLVEAAGGRVRLVEGDRRNLKITYPDDLLAAAALLRAMP